jgi:hypothetical protein
MMCRAFSSQKGFSLIMFAMTLVILIVVGLAILSFLPRIGGTSLDVINQITSRARSVVGGMTEKASELVKKLDPVKERLSRKLEDLKDWWFRYKNKDTINSEGFKSRSLTWVGDMQLLIDLAKEQGYDMSEVIYLMDRYNEGTASAKRVEAEYWLQLQNQTADIIEENIERFRTRPLGCSDFTDELKKIWEIEQNFNAETLEGYFVAKYVSQQLHDPRSLEFAQDLFGWLGYEGSNWYMEQLTLSIPQENQTPDYPTIIQKIDARMQGSNNPFEWVAGNITAAEIYLNYDLVIPAENRFDEAIRHLSTLMAHYGKTIPQERSVGLHMALALLNERVCKNDDLAIKEFKDVVAIAQHMGLQCEHYNDAHYHLGIINLRLREGNQVQPEFAGGTSSVGETLEELYEATPTPEPTPTPTPVPTPNPIKIIVEIPLKRTLRAPEEVMRSRGLDPTARSGMKVIKGDIVIPRDIRLRPRIELGETQKMKEFSVDNLYDLSNIPDGAIREFEFYLQCSSEGPRVDIARYIHDKYMGR